MMKKITAIGEALIDFIPYADIRTASKLVISISIRSGARLLHGIRS